jgi:sorting nexin-1/2
MQLDTEDGETFIPPAGIVASPSSEPAQSATDPAEPQDSENSDARAAAEATREMDE